MCSRHFTSTHDQQDCSPSNEGQPRHAHMLLHQSKYSVCYEAVVNQRTNCNPAGFYAQPPSTGDDPNTTTPRYSYCDNRTVFDMNSNNRLLASRLETISSPSCTCQKGYCQTVRNNPSSVAPPVAQHLLRQTNTYPGTVFVPAASAPPPPCLCPGDRLHGPDVSIGLTGGAGGGGGGQCAQGTPHVSRRLPAGCESRFRRQQQESGNGPLTDPFISVHMKRPGVPQSSQTPVRNYLVSVDVHTKPDLEDHCQRKGEENVDERALKVRMDMAVQTDTQSNTSDQLDYASESDASGESSDADESSPSYPLLPVAARCSTDRVGHQTEATAHHPVSCIRPAPQSSVDAPRGDSEAGRGEPAGSPGFEYRQVGVEEYSRSTTGEPVPTACNKRNSAASLDSGRDSTYATSGSDVSGPGCLASDHTVKMSEFCSLSTTTLSSSPKSSDSSVPSTHESTKRRASKSPEDPPLSFAIPPLLEAPTLLSCGLLASATTTRPETSLVHSPITCSEMLAYRPGRLVFSTSATAPTFSLYALSNPGDRRIVGPTYGLQNRPFVTATGQSVGSRPDHPHPGLARRPNESQAAVIRHGDGEAQRLTSWLHSIGLIKHSGCLLQAGYDLWTLCRATPEELNACGVTNPSDRRHLRRELGCLRLPSSIPDQLPVQVSVWLMQLGLESYWPLLHKHGYVTFEECSKLTWEDLEEIGITKLGHQKKFILAIAHLQRLLAQKRVTSPLTVETADDLVHTNRKQALCAGDVPQQLWSSPCGRKYCSESPADSSRHTQALPKETIAPVFDEKYCHGQLRRLSVDTACSRAVVDDRCSSPLPSPPPAFQDPAALPGGEGFQVEKRSCPTAGRVPAPPIRRSSISSLGSSTGCGGGGEVDRDFGLELRRSLLGSNLLKTYGWSDETGSAHTVSSTGSCEKNSLPVDSSTPSSSAQLKQDSFYSISRGTSIMSIPNLPAGLELAKGNAFDSNSNENMRNYPSELALTSELLDPDIQDMHDIRIMLDVLSEHLTMSTKL